MDRQTLMRHLSQLAARVLQDRSTVSDSGSGPPTGRLRCIEGGRGACCLGQAPAMPISEMELRKATGQSGGRDA